MSSPKPQAGTSFREWPSPTLKDTSNSPVLLRSPQEEQGAQQGGICGGAPAGSWAPQEERMSCSFHLGTPWVGEDKAVVLKPSQLREVPDKIPPTACSPGTPLPLTAPTRRSGISLLCFFGHPTWLCPHTSCFPVICRPSDSHVTHGEGRLQLT